MKPVYGDSHPQADEFLIPVSGDGDEEEEVKSALEVGEVSPEETPVKSTPDEAKSTEDFSAKFDEMRRKYETDISKVKSSLQKRETELVKEKTVLEKKLNELLKSTLSTDDREQYERNQLQEELENIRSERDALKEEHEQSKQFYTWVDYFTDAGISKSELILDDGLPGLFSSGMSAIQAKMKSLEESKGVPNPAQKKAKSPPEVAQSAKSRMSTIVNLDEAIKHFADGDDEKFWRMAEHGDSKVLQVLSELSSQ